MHSLQRRSGAPGKGLRLAKALWRWCPRPYLDSPRIGLAALVLFWGTTACTGVFARPGTSLSFGDHAQGRLLSGVQLPFEGMGYQVPPAWRSREAVFTTEQIAAGLLRSFAAVARLHPGAVAPLGDLAHRGGGPAMGHASHCSGRDIDIFFYAVDERGNSLSPGPAMLKFNREGRAVAWSPPHGALPPRLPVPVAWFDKVRTLALLRALFADPSIEVQWVFIQRDLAKLVFHQAVFEGESADMLARLAELLRQPGDSAPHDDHMHVRIYCDPQHRAYGCVDRGPQRWLKKHWKYLRPRSGFLPSLDPAVAMSALK